MMGIYCLLLNKSHEREKKNEEEKITDRECEMEENGTGKGLVGGIGAECVHAR